MTMRKVLRALPLALVTIVVYFVFLQLQTHTKDSPKLPLRDSRRKGPLRVEDIFIAVKTTGRFHSIRLALLLDTWISRTKKHVSTITQSVHTITSCSPEHNHQALSCKMAAEYDHFMASDKEWLCHVDDDNYLNPRPLLDLLTTFPPNSDVYIGKPSLDRPMRAQELLEGNKTVSLPVSFWFATGGAGFCINRGLAEKMAPWASGVRFEQTSAVIRLPDDCAMGFIVEKRLGVSMIHSNLFHSHLENLLKLTPREILNQVRLLHIFRSVNSGSPLYRFKTLHCLLTPLKNQCRTCWNREDIVKMITYSSY
uniref:MFNG O-fucosylpeptide 3-beta-N-acetylglucosaminyltransferase n=1 Tax=Astyanax mexicanus TaxID=7994 RepID=A0A3B1JLB6_ASTMX